MKKTQVNHFQFEMLGIQNKCVYILIIILLSSNMNKKNKCEQKYRKYSAYDNEQSVNVGFSIKGVFLSPEERSERKVSTDVSSSSNNYKTQVCKYWEIDKPCPFQQKCVFAHGDVQIRSKDGISEKYKTKKCKNFFQNIYCPYGQRCQFIHIKPQKSKITRTLTQIWFGLDFKNYHISLSKKRSQKKIEKQLYRKTQWSQKKPRRQNNKQDYQLQNPEPLIQNEIQYFNQVPDIEVFPQYFQKPRLYSL